MKKFFGIFIALFLGIVMAFGVAGCNVGTQDDLQRTIDDLQSRIEELEEQISERDATIEDLSELIDKLEEMQDRLAELEEQIGDRDATIADLKKLINELEKLEDQVRNRDATIEELNEQIKNLKEQIEQLEKEIAEKFPEEAESMGTFYTLKDVYDNDWLTQSDLQTIANYHNKGIPYPESLSDNIAKTIKKSWAKREKDIDPTSDITEEKVIILQYYGTYNECVAVIVDRIDAIYPAVVHPITIEIGNVTFIFNDPGPQIVIFKF